jgi:hypothetical protein
MTADDDICAFVEDSENGQELLNLSQSYKSEPVKWQGQEWIIVKSIMDSGASAPVAPPSMGPNVPIVESPGSKRGQVYNTASQQKLANLGQQHLHAVTAEGAETEVLFQIADVSKPLVSVSTICERGNRVVFGKGGGYIHSLASGNKTPFYRQNGIYVLEMWLLNEPMPFRRQP